MYIPKYVETLLEDKRLRLAAGEEQAEHPEALGYTFRLYRRTNGVYDGTFVDEAERLCAWARNKYADAYTTKLVCFTEKEHRKPYYKRDFWLMVITDPVAIILEKRMEKHDKS